MTGEGKTPVDSEISSFVPVSSDAGMVSPEVLVFDRVTVTIPFSSGIRTDGVIW